MSDYYDLLKINRNASPTEIKKAWRKAAMQHHPDKGGDKEMFQKIQKAYETLSDPKTKELYDQYGEQGLEQGFNPSPFGSEMPFPNMFDFMFKHQSSKGPNKKYIIKVELEEVYHSKKKEFHYERIIYCKACEGKGGLPQNSTSCSSCRGKGVRVQINTTQNIITQSPCTDCDASGVIFSVPCVGCDGNKVLKKKMKATFTPEAFRNHVVLEKQGDRVDPNIQPGDIVINILFKSHPKYQISNRFDLVTKKEISLYDAITGFSFDFEDLDGNTETIEVRNVVTQTYKHKIPQKGLKKENGLRGDMVFEFDIKFPTSLLTKDDSIEKWFMLKK